MAFMDPIFHTFGLYSPNLVGALVVLIVGWLIALIVSSLIGKALHSTGLDEKIARKVVGWRRESSIYAAASTDLQDNLLFAAVLCICGILRGTGPDSGGSAP
ncbi:MAG: hypothetical protein JW999_04280 [Methanotrichaceae archaeon]|nr:hypothetical protein [Methanotrichaceae archaeon]